MLGFESMWVEVLMLMKSVVWLKTLLLLTMMTAAAATGANSKTRGWGWNP